MDVQEIIKALSKTREPRATIYLNNQSIERFFTQRVSAIREFVKSEQLSGRLSAGVFSFLKSEVGGQNSTGQKVELDSLLQAILIEEVEKEAGHLLDLKAEEPQAGSLIYYLGDIHIADEAEDIGKDVEEGMPPSFVKIIQQEASRQDKVIKKENSQLEVVTTYGSLERRAFAAIVSSKWIDYGSLASYGFPPIGMIGRLERVRSGVAFIAPFWIWHDGW